MSILANILKLIPFIFLLFGIAVVMQVAKSQQTNDQWYWYNSQFSRWEEDFWEPAGIILFGATLYNGAAMSDELLISDGCRDLMRDCEITTNRALLPNATAFLYNSTNYRNNRTNLIGAIEIPNSKPWFAVGLKNSTEMHSGYSFCQICRHFLYQENISSNRTVDDTIDLLNVTNEVV